MDKIYTLPDLPTAPTSDLQLLVRRLIEYADLSTLPAIEDELREQNRTTDIIELRSRFAYNAYRRFQSPIDPNYPNLPFRWLNEVNGLIVLFWFDLFNWQSLIQCLSAALDLNPPAIYEEEPVNPGPQPFLVTDTIQAGEWGMLEYQPRTIRRALPTEIPNQQETV